MSELLHQAQRDGRDFLYAFRRYGQVMFALLQREIENRRRAPLEAIMDVLEPIMFVALMGVLWGFLNRRQSSPLGDHPLLFIGTGFYAKFLWISVARIPRRTISSQRRFPVERRLDYILVHVLVTTCEYLLLAFVGFGILYLWFTPGAFPTNFVAIVEAIAALVALGFGWGVITLVIGKYFWAWPYIAGGINRAMILFSGVFFLAEFLPPQARWVLSLNPILHGVALFRSGFYPSYPTILLDTTYLAYCSLVAVVIGLVLERVTLRSEGS